MRQTHKIEREKYHSVYSVILIELFLSEDFFGFQLKLGGSIQ